MNNDPEYSEELTSDLKEIGGIEIREMAFTGGKKKTEPGSSEGKLEILGILVDQKPDVVKSVQKILTAYGCNIRTRLGVNEVFFGEPAGLIILELTGDKKQRDLLEKDLKTLDQVKVRKMIF